MSQSSLLTGGSGDKKMRSTAGGGVASSAMLTCGFRLPLRYQHPRGEASIADSVRQRSPQAGVRSFVNCHTTTTLLGEVVWESV